jgi:formate--tetrahydrofolate ligase
MKSDIEIAQAAKLRRTSEIAEELGIPVDDYIPYGHYKGKVALSALDREPKREDGKLILVSAVTPTPAGEGKSTTTVGLGQALNRIGRKTIVALREPSLGPCFGIKGGAAGGGFAQIVPMEEINLHFTGDFHAITSAHALLCAMLDNSIHWSNALDIDVRDIPLRRVVDMNDRGLRDIVLGLGGKVNGVPRESGFDITVASEVMAILCLSSDLQDCRRRLGEIVVGFTRKGAPVRAADLRANGAMTALLRDAMNPNLVQTLENTPALVHGGPFANIAHGCNSIVATRIALRYGDYAVTEAGFGFDLGGEKFLDIKCPYAGLTPSGVVLVATVRALKMHGGVPKEKLAEENVEALKIGVVNLERHLDSVKLFGLPAVVAINRFPTDSSAEIDWLLSHCRELGIPAALSEVFEKGGEGGVELAEVLLSEMERKPAQYEKLYPWELPVREKIESIARRIYGAGGVRYSKKAAAMIDRIETLGFGKLPVNMAKTPYSFSDDPKLLGRPAGFDITIDEVRLSAGAGFVVAIAGEIMTMPGLPKVPSAEKIDVTPEGRIVGLF